MNGNAMFCMSRRFEYLLLLLLLLLFLLLPVLDFAHHLVQNMCTVAWNISKGATGWGYSKMNVFSITKIRVRSKKFWKFHSNKEEQNLLNNYKFRGNKLVNGFKIDCIAFLQFRLSAAWKWLGSIKPIFSC